MPVQRLTTQPTTVNPFDILAIADPGVPDLFFHVALCIEKSVRDDVTNASDLTCYHMVPPLGRDSLKFDLAGNAELTDDKIARIKRIVGRQRSGKNAERERRRKLGIKWETDSQYRIHPAITDPDKDCSCWGYSCVGFVVHAYQKSGIRLGRGPFSLKTLDDLKLLYPQVRHLLDDPAQRHKFGIGQGDQWPIMLVGYVVHAMNRPSKKIHGPLAIPYLPIVGDEYFPQR